jgi:hypothetical protein
MPRRCSTNRPGGAATARSAAGARLRSLSPRFDTLWPTRTAWPGTGVCLPLRCSHPCSRARRAARRSGSRTRCRRRRRVTARRLPFSPPARKTRVEARFTSSALRPQLKRPAINRTAPRPGRRDARSGPGFDGAARHDARSLLPTCTRGLARRPAHRQSISQRCASTLEGNNTERNQGRGKEMGMAAVLTVGRRCRRGRLVDGAALLLRRGSRPLGEAGVHADAFLPRLVVAVRACALLVPGSPSDTNGAFLLAHGRRLPNTFLLRSSAPARRASHSHLASPSPASPPSSFPRWRLWNGAKTPMRVVARPATPCPPFELAPRNLEGEKPRLPLVRRRPGPDGGRGLAPPASDAKGIRAAVSFLFSPRSPLGPRAHVGLGVRASRSAWPRAPPRAGWRGRTGGARRLGVWLADAGEGERGREDKR